MQLLSDEDAQAWCTVRGAAVESLGSGPPSFIDGMTSRMRVAIPNEATAAVGLAYVLVMAGVPDHAEAQFQGALLWLRRWHLWSESIDRVGELLLVGANEEIPGIDTLEATPGLAFPRGAFARVHASLCVPMLFQWDAWYCPNGGHLFATLSHHGQLDIFASRVVIRQEMQRFAQWEPVEV